MFIQESLFRILILNEDFGKFLIIENNEPAKIIGREKFKQYRRWGIEPQTFKL